LKSAWRGALRKIIIGLLSAMAVSGLLAGCGGATSGADLITRNVTGDLDSQGEDAVEAADAAVGRLAAVCDGNLFFVANNLTNSEYKDASQIFSDVNVTEPSEVEKLNGTFDEKISIDYYTNGKFLRGTYIPGFNDRDISRYPFDPSEKPTATDSFKPITSNWFDGSGSSSDTEDGTPFKLASVRLTIKDGSIISQEMSILSDVDGIRSASLQPIGKLYEFPSTVFSSYGGYPESKYIGNLNSIFSESLDWAKLNKARTLSCDEAKSPLKAIARLLTDKTGWKGPARLTPLDAYLPSASETKARLISAYKANNPFSDSPFPQMQEQLARNLEEGVSEQRVVENFRIITEVRNVFLEAIGLKPERDSTLNQQEAAAPQAAAEEPDIPLPNNDQNQSATNVASVNAKPSFDCAKASTGAERLICSDPRLAKADADLMADYRSLFRKYPDSSLQQIQRDWLRQVRDRCADATCMLKAYRSRRIEMRDQEFIYIEDQQGL